MTKFNSIEHEVIYKKLREIAANKNENVYLPDNSLNDDGFDQYFKELQQYINIMSRNRENYAYRHIFSHRKVLGPVIVFAKKIMRKFLKWYIEPITFQQTDFNNAVTPAIGRLTELVARYDKENNYTQEQIANYNDMLEGISRKQEILQQKVIELERLNEIQAQQIIYANQQLKKLNELEILNSGDASIFEKKTYSQSGEDSILAYICFVLGFPFEAVTYIDLGANHAKEMSNTYFFYAKGARGVLVEANPDLIPELKFFRNRDIILNNVIDTVSGKEVDFYILNGDGLSTPSYESALNFCDINENLRITSQHKVKTIDYKTIAENYLGTPPTILSIDIEGMDLDILNSIDYEKYRPAIIVVEMISYNKFLNYKSKNKAISEYLDDKGYDEYAFTGINSIFVCRKFLEERNGKL